VYAEKKRIDRACKCKHLEGVYQLMSLYQLAFPCPGRSHVDHASAQLSADPLADVFFKGPTCTSHSRFHSVPSGRLHAADVPCMCLPDIEKARLSRAIRLAVQVELLSYRAKTALMN